MGETKKKDKTDRSLLRVLVGGYLVYLGVKLFKGALAEEINSFVFIIFSVLFVAVGLLCAARAVYIMAHKPQG